MTGPIPTNIGNLVDLKTLMLNCNRLNGTDPYSLKNLFNLESLILSRNCLTGGISNKGINVIKSLEIYKKGNAYNQLTETCNASFDILCYDLNYNCIEKGLLKGVENKLCGFCQCDTDKGSNCYKQNQLGRILKGLNYFDQYIYGDGHNICKSPTNDCNTKAFEPGTNNGITIDSGYNVQI